MDVDYGRYTSTLTVYHGADVDRYGQDDREYVKLDDIDKVDGPESATPGEPSTVHPESPGGADVYVALDERHGVYSGKPGRLTKMIEDWTNHNTGEAGTFFEFRFPDDPDPVWVDRHCVYGRCRKHSTHPTYWYHN